MGRQAVAPRVLVAITTALLSVLAFTAPAISTAAPRLPGPANPVRVYPLGDSITLGVSSDAPGGYSPGGYRSALDELLSDAGIKHVFIGTRTSNSSPSLILRGQTHHDGHSGLRVDQVSRGLDSVLNTARDHSGYWLTGTPDRAPLNPDVVVIHVGTNDILQWYDPAYRYPTPNGLVDYSDPVQRAQFVSDLTARLKVLVEKVVRLRPTAHVVLSSIVPMETNSFEPVSHDYAYAIADLVTEERALHHQVQFADPYHHFVKVVGGQVVFLPGLMAAGGIHPTPAGYQVLARVYTETIRTAIGR